MSHRSAPLRRTLVTVVALAAAVSGSLVGTAGSATAAPAASAVTASTTVTEVATRDNTGPRYRSYIAYRLTNAGLRRGEKATFKVRISGPAGVPTGKVQLLLQGELVGKARLDAGGLATLRSYRLPKDLYNVRIRYSGSATYFPNRTEKLFFGVA